jgi:hypothetical protein
MPCLLSQKKCAECGADLGVTFQKMRGFYVNDDGELEEDGNLEIMGPPEFVVHCTNDTEDQWYPNNLSEEEQEELYKWEDEVIQEVKSKFFKGE